MNGAWQHHQLVVIGNGFDLSCGLPSGFPSFFGPRLVKLNELNGLTGKELSRRCREEGLTAWDMLLETIRNRLGGTEFKNWCDIEKAISMVVLCEGWDAEDVDPRLPIPTALVLCGCLDWLRPDEDAAGFMGAEGGSLGDEERDNDFSSDAYGFSCSYAEEYDESVVAIAQYLDATYHEKEWSQARVLNALLDELNKLERQFSDYLVLALERHADYSSNSASLLKRIVSYADWNLEDGSVSTTVLDFNYTTPGAFQYTGCGEVELRNIHGILGKGVVFGIDGAGHMDSPGEAGFTKTYRLLGLQAGSLCEPIAFGNERLDAKSTMLTEAIKVFGHSLAEADYSYFQSIFDMVDLYGSNVKLYFLYQNYCDGAKDETYWRATSLLSAYGATMDNKDHGKNLVHKLILEGRLAVAEI